VWPVAVDLREHPSLARWVATGRSPAIASGLRPVIFGLFAGLLVSIVGAVALQQAFRATPIGLDVGDPIAYLAVVLLLGGIALATMLGPALRAGSSDPLHALRHD